MIIAGAGCYDKVYSTRISACIAQENSEDLHIALEADSGNADLTRHTLLMRSAYQGSCDIINVLLSKGVSPNPKDGTSSTALDLAVDAGFYRVASLLLDYGASLSLSRHACSILEVSARHPGPPEIEISAPDSLEIDLPREQLGGIPAAVKSGNVAQLQQILEDSSGPGTLDLEDGSETGSTPFLIASCMGNQDVMNNLISHGANINATNRLGWTSLMLAAKREDQNTICFLLDQGADVNHHSPDRWTALAEAASRRNKSILKLLLDAGADPESVSQHDWTPLMHVAYHGDVGAVDMLIDAGASVHHGSQRDESPLLLAAASGSAVVVKKLLDEGCPPNPAWLMPAMDEELASVERTSQLGWTPLMLACQVGSLAIVHMLVDAGASTEPRSPMSKNALEIARENGWLDIVSYLEHLEGSRRTKEKIHKPE
ncbi:MAG: hypothetical protein Q9171_004965 [Xanthocarpia ochracea]